MNRKKALDRIAELLARFKAEVYFLNQANLYDINIHAENVLIPLLNEVYQLNLVNANYTEEKNFSAIDLIDTANRVSVQVTSTADSDKIKHTLNQFIKYERENSFDTLFVYIITEKQQSYSGKGFEDILQGKLDFDKDNHIIDHSDLFTLLSSSMGLGKIRNVLELLEQEFTEEKIEYRRHLIDNTIDLPKERIFPNSLELSFPSTLYVADLQLNREEVIEKSWETDYKLKKSATDRSVMKRAIAFAEREFYRDWHIFGKKLITFRSVQDSSDSLYPFLDQGTIETMTPEEFIQISPQYLAAFSKLLGFCLEEKLDGKQIQWVYKSKLFRFRPDNPVGAKQFTWKKTNTATRTVIFELRTKDKTKVTAYRHLAFKANIRYLDGIWHLILNPTWSFTYNGYQKSKYEAKSLSGLKKLENNKTIYYAFRFLAYYMSTPYDNEHPYHFLKISKPKSDEITYQLY